MARWHKPEVGTARLLAARTGGPAGGRGLGRWVDVQRRSHGWKTEMVVGRPAGWGFRNQQRMSQRGGSVGWHSGQQRGDRIWRRPGSEKEGRRWFSGGRLQVGAWAARGRSPESEKMELGALHGRRQQMAGVGEDGVQWLDLRKKADVGKPSGGGWQIWRAWAAGGRSPDSEKNKGGGFFCSVEWVLGGVS